MSDKVGLSEGGPHVTAHQHSSNHRVELSSSSTCGCFHCSSIFPPGTIQEWVDEDEDGLGQTALCPHCGIDSVFGSSSGFPIDRQFPGRMRAHGF